MLWNWVDLPLLSLLLGYLRPVFVWAEGGLCSFEFCVLVTNSFLLVTPVTTSHALFNPNDWLLVVTLMRFVCLSVDMFAGLEVGGLIDELVDDGCLTPNGYNLEVF